MVRDSRIAALSSEQALQAFEQGALGNEGADRLLARQHEAPIGNDQLRAQGIDRQESAQLGEAPEVARNPRVDEKQVRDLLLVGHELTRYFKCECSGHAPSHQIVGALRLYAPDEAQVPGRDFFQRIGQRGISYRWIEQLQGVDRLFRTQILGQAVIDSGVVDDDQGALRAVGLNLDHLAKIEFAQIRLCQYFCEFVQRRRQKQRCQLDAPSELPLDLRQHARSQQGVAAQFEKIVVGCNRLYAQHRGPE